MKYQYTYIITAKVKNSDSAGKDEEKLDLSYIADVNAKWHSHYKNSIAAYIVLKSHYLAYDLVSTLLGI